MAPIQRLPFELKEQIAREFCDFDLYDQRNYRIDPSGDSFLNGHTYEWKPLPEAGGKPQLSFQPVYDDLRALSLVSRNFRDPAQRALFSIVIFGEPTTYFKLLRSLLEAPDTRSYIRCLFAVAVRNPEAEQRHHEIVKSCCADFVEILGPIVVSNSYDGLRNGRYFYGFKHRILLHGDTVSSSPDRKVSDMRLRRDFAILVKEVLHSILQLCPSLKAFHLHYSHWSSGKHEDPCAFWSLEERGWACIRLLKDRPLLTTLTIDVRAVRGVLNLAWNAKSSQYPSTIEHLTLIGSTTKELTHDILVFDHVFAWVSTITRLKTLRIWNGFGNRTLLTTHNWNTILRKFKATLEQLVVDGAGSLLQMTPSEIIGPRAYQQVDRFGPSGILACLPEMEKLRYLSVPIHYLRRCPEGKNPLEILIMPNEGQDVRQVVEADVKFPKSLERAEVMMVEQVQNYRITEVKALRIDLGKGATQLEK